MPRCFGASASVRASRMPKSAVSAFDVHTFWPFTTNWSPSRRARVCRPARSLPAPGSLNSWHHISSPRSMAGQEAVPLLVGAEVEDRRADHGVGHHERAGGHPEGRDLLGEDDLLHDVAAPAVPLPRVADAGPAAVPQRALPRRAALHQLVVVHPLEEAVGEVVGRAPGDGVGLEPGAGLGPERGLVGGVVDVHRRHDNAF